MSEHALLFEHDVKYTNKEPLPVHDVVQSLLALERISRRFLPRTINALTGAEVSEAQLFVLGFEHGSLKEKLVIKLIFGNEEKLDAFLDKVREGKFGDAFKEVLSELPGGHRMKITAISAILLALVGVGVGVMLRDDPAPPDTTNVFIIGAESYKQSPEQFAQIVRAAVGDDSRKLAQDVARVVAPAKTESDATIVMNDQAAMTIPRDVVDAVPDEYEPEVAESNIAYHNVIVEIRATDRDNAKSGWSGIVKGLFDKRVKMELAEGVDATALSRRMQVHADVHVISKPGKKHTMEPRRMIIDRVVEQIDERKK